MTQRTTDLSASYSSENPLIWSVLNILRHNPSGWKIHTLASILSEKGMIPVLDTCSEKDLFKRNFLLMNALYQLQEMLFPKQWLNVESMEIELMRLHPVNHSISVDDPMREYYMDWGHYEADETEIKRLLNQFWTRYRQHVGVQEVTMSRKLALEVLELNEWATERDIRKSWRKLALKWHPDREGGDERAFRRACEAWSVLKGGNDSPSV
jgi:hypothetical protein